MLLPICKAHGGSAHRGRRTRSGGAPSYHPSESRPPRAWCALLELDAGGLGALGRAGGRRADLAAEIAHFTTLDRCVAERAPRLDPLLGDTLEAIGYGTFVRDACRVIEATKAVNPERCGAIEASVVANACRATVAEESPGTPDACPWDNPRRPARGRNPCASRSRRAEHASVRGGAQYPEERTTCQATADAHSGALSGTLGAGAGRALPLHAERGPLAIGSRDARAGSAPARPWPSRAARCTSSREREHAGHRRRSRPGARPRGDARRAARRGALRPWTATTSSGVDFVAPSPNGRASLALGFACDAPAVKRGPGRPRGPPQRRRRRDGGDAAAARTIERAELLVPGGPAVGAPIARSTLEAGSSPSRSIPHGGARSSFIVDGELGAVRTRPIAFMPSRGKRSCATSSAGDRAGRPVRDPATPCRIP